MKSLRNYFVRPACSALLAGVPVHAQIAESTHLGELRPELLLRIDQTVSDYGPLSVSARVVPIDLLRPTSFEDVYLVPNRPHLFMRVHGGVAAVFSRSIYTATPWGMRPEIPPGTIFHIGSIGPEPFTGGLVERDPRWPTLDFSARQRADDPAPSSPRTDARREEVTIWVSEEYRRHRLAVLVDRARGTVDGGQLTGEE